MSMTQQEAGQLVHAIIRAVKRGEPLPPIPEGVPAPALSHIIFLGEMYRDQEAKDKQ